MSSILKLRKSTAAGFAATDAFAALGEAAFAPFNAVRAPGRVLWVNFELARELGFDAPRSNQLTAAFEKQLLSKLSLRSVTSGDSVPATEIVRMYADRYGGEGVSPALGAGRAGFLRDANLYVKGIGFTPLFAHNDKDDFVHSHGGVHLEDCMSEAIFGEVDHNLFERGASRIVAIIDQGLFVTEPSGRRRHIALAVRTGAQLRPGHLLAKRVRGSRSPVELFIEITRTTKQLVMHAGTGDPDLSATMLRIIDDHARTAADSFRWRMIHGALSPSNMDVSGAMLDLPTQSTQPRTAPIFKLDYVQSTFGTEHKERGFHLAEMYRRVLRTTDAATRERFNLKWINVSNEMDRAYERHLQVKLIAATGLRTEVARKVQRQTDLAAHFTEVLLAMATLKNAGSTCVARRIVNLSVVDVFNVLANLPHDYFTKKDLEHSVLKHAHAVCKGAAKKRTVEKLATEFGLVYRALMEAAKNYYVSRAEMESSIRARAAFENQPIDALYCHPLYEDLNRVIAEYKASGNAQIISDAIDTRIAQSLRSVDGLLSRGTRTQKQLGALIDRGHYVTGVRNR